MSNKRKACQSFEVRTSRHRGQPDSENRPSEPEAVPIPSPRSFVNEVDKPEGVSAEVSHETQIKLGDLPDELLMMALFYLRNDKFSLDALALTAKRFHGTVRTTRKITRPIALLSGSGSDPKADPAGVIAQILHYLCSLSPDTDASIIQSHASGFKTLSIDRQHKYNKTLPANIFTATIIDMIAKTIGSLPGLTVKTRTVWLRQVRNRYEPAVVGLLLTLLSGLEYVNLSGDLTCLWHRHRLGCVTSFKSLSTLHLRQITNEELPDNCCCLMRSPNLEELAFFDMTLTGRVLVFYDRRAWFSSTKLSVTTLRLIRCYLPSYIWLQLLEICMNLEAFEYTISLALCVKEGPEPIWHTSVWRSLLKHKASLRRLVFTGSAGAITEGMFLADLREFSNLQYLEVDQNFLLPSRIQADLQVDYETLLNHLPKSLKTFKLHECTSQVAIKILEMAAHNYWSELVTLKLAYLPQQKGLCATRASLEKLQSRCEEKGISVFIEETEVVTEYTGMVLSSIERRRLDWSS